MTLHIVLSCPQSSPYKARVSIQDQVYDPETKTMTEDFREAQVIEINRGECVDTYLTSTRRILITELPADAPKS